MLELDITHMVENDGDEIPLLSGSVAELGPNARILTWENSKSYAEAHPLLNTPEQIEEAKDYFRPSTREAVTGCHLGTFPKTVLGNSR